MKVLIVGAGIRCQVFSWNLRRNLGQVRCQA
jgi:hypothetical protein